MGTGPGDDDLLGFLMEMDRKMSSFADRLSKMEEQADAMRQDIQAAIQRRAGAAGRTPFAPVKRPLSWAGSPGGGAAATFEWGGSGPEGRYFRVNGGPWLTVKNSLADLLEVLTEPRPPAADGLLGWRSSEEVREALGYPKPVS